MKIYKLVFNNNNTLAISKDKWLLKLYVVQRRIDQSKINIEKQKVEDNVIYLDNFLSYYYGYSITNLEKDYIECRGLDIESDIDNAIELVNKISLLKKKKIKKRLKRFRDTSSIPNVTTFLNELIDNASEVNDYMLNRTMFRLQIRE